jgi:hypothetical protein
MKQYLLPENGRFYKANLHVHTTISDGKMTPQETKEGYMAHGYSIVAFTDHEVFVPQNGLTDDAFLAINAVELAINDGWPGGFKYNKSTHLNLYAMTPDQTECAVCAGKFVWLEQSKPYITKEMEEHPYKSHCSTAGFNHMIKTASDAGFLVCLNHPAWSLLDPDDYKDLKGLWGIEVYNTGCFKCGLADTEQPMVDLLRRNEHVMPVAADDNHDTWAQFGGWLMVKADKLEYKTVMNALERGEFYASTGPEIRHLSIDGNRVTVRTSPCQCIQIVTEGRRTKDVRAADGGKVTEAVFELLPEDGYFRVRVEDGTGARAYSQAYSVAEIY